MDASDFVKKLSEKGLDGGEKEKEMEEYVKSYELDFIKKHEAKNKNKNLTSTTAFDIVKSHNDDKEGGGEEEKNENVEGSLNDDEMMEMETEKFSILNQLPAEE